MIPWSDVLRAHWMPRATPEVFLGTMSSQSPAAFAREFAKVTTRIERELRVVANGSQVLPFGHWRWPAAAEVQATLRTELMARLAAPTSDNHSERLPATADVMCSTTLTGVQLQLAAVLGPVLVTAYRPVEQMVPVGARSPLVAVGKR